jgi:hypothetical protein
MPYSILVVSHGTNSEQFKGRTGSPEQNEHRKKIRRALVAAFNRSIGSIASII